MPLPTLRSQIRLALTLLAACAALALALLGAAPAAMSAEGLGGGSSFNRLTEPTQETTPRTTAPVEQTSSSNSTAVVVLALVAAIGLLVAIAYVIARDARRVAPVTDGRSTGPMGDPAARLRRRRARAKAARRQRKRNR